MEGERLISELHKASNNGQQWQQLQEELFIACEKEKHHVIMAHHRLQKQCNTESNSI